MENDPQGAGPDEGLTQEDSRRGFLVKATLALQAVMGMIVAVPVVGAFIFPLWGKTTRKPRGFLSLGDAGRFKVGQPQKVTLSGDARDAWADSRGVSVGAVWVVRRGPREFDVYSTTCPHLGCAINWQAHGEQFLCPCHGSHFNLEGQRYDIEGHSNPSPRDMDPLESKVDGDRLLVRYQRFKFGTTQRVALS